MAADNRTFQEDENDEEPMTTLAPVPDHGGKFEPLVDLRSTPGEGSTGDGSAEVN